MMLKYINYVNLYLNRYLLSRYNIEAREFISISDNPSKFSGFKGL